MDINPKNLKRGFVSWHYETLPRATKNALDFFSNEKWLEESSWYLAGGTALALQCGNRVSLDLDFFTRDSNFETNELLNILPRPPVWNTTLERKNTLYGEYKRAKVSFIAYPFFIPEYSPIFHGSIKVLDKRDVAIMKIIAISQRGKKRDFFDLYWCVKNIDSLEVLIKRLKKQYPSVAHDYNHIMKSLVYFNDAEDDPEPNLFFNATWTEVKKYFQKEVPIITKKLIGLTD